MKQRNLSRLFALFLALALLIPLFPIVQAEEFTEAEIDTAVTVEQLTADTKIFDYIDEETFSSNKHVKRLEEEETLSSYVFLNNDGTKTVYYTYQEVKYKAADGTIVEKDISLVNTAKGYTTASNDVGLTLPNDPANGIGVSYSGYDILLTPVGGKLRKPVQSSETAVSYPDYFGAGTTLVYTPTLDGVKEDIVLSHYTGVNSFSFHLQTDGLKLYLENNSYYLAASEDAEMRIEMGDIVSFDARGRFSIGELSVKTITLGSEYLLTVTVDKEFLTDENTVYPVSIDPTFYVSDRTHGANAIEDVTIYSGRPNVNGDWTYLHCGYYDSTYQVARTLFRFKALLTDPNYTSCTPKEIKSARFRIKEASGTAAQHIEIYQYIGSSSWTESGATWANITQNEDEDDYVTYAIADNNAATLFDVTDLLKNWKSNPTKINQGIILKCVNETVDKAFYSSEYSDIMSRPYVEITYYDLLPTSGSELEYRPDLWGFPVKLLCNCYSYMLNNQVYMDTSDVWYAQQPGYYSSYEGDINSVDNLIEAVTMDCMAFHNLPADQVFKEVSEETVCGPNMYKVALFMATGGSYHWLRQDADGFWSHKNLHEDVTNLDSSNNLISKPSEATIILDIQYNFVGYYAVRPWDRAYQYVEGTIVYGYWQNQRRSYSFFVQMINESNRLTLRE